MVARLPTGARANCMVCLSIDTTSTFATINALLEKWAAPMWRSFPLALLSMPLTKGLRAPW